MLIILAGFGLLLVSSAGQGNASSDGIVFIRPFPIVFGSGPGGPRLAIITVVIGGVMFAVLLLWGWRFYKMRSGEP